jgi:hypothetical protein
MLWAISFATSSDQLQPKGLVLMSKRQLVVPGGSQKQFYNATERSLSFSTFDACVF